MTPALVDRLRELAGPALRSVASTVGVHALLALLLGVELMRAAVSPGPGQQRLLLAAVLAATLVFAVAAAAGTVLGLKRGVLRGLAVGLERFQLASALVKLIFDRLSGSQVARALERLPLAQAEQRLREAIDWLTGEAAAQGGHGLLVGWLRVRLLERTGELLLDRFRAEDRAHGGVDLAKVQAEVGGVIDAQLGAALAGASRRLLLLGLGVVVLAFGVARLLLARL